MKRLVKAVASTIWRGARMMAPARGIYAPILCYHSVNAEWNDDCDPLPPALFAQHLAFLQGHAHVVPLAHLVDLFLAGSPLPERCVALTFDDGYRDNFEVAFPLLRRFAIPATIFVVTGFIDGSVTLIPEAGWEAMTWDQVREMDAGGLIDFGAHTHTHRLLSTLDDASTANEIIRSKSELEQQLGRPVRLFAYPNGQGRDITPRAIDAVRRSGYAAAFSTFWRSTQDRRRPYLMNRIMIHGSDTVDDLRRKLCGDEDYIYGIHVAKAMAHGGTWK